MNNVVITFPAVCIFIIVCLVTAIVGLVMIVLNLMKK